MFYVYYTQYKGKIYSREVKDGKEAFSRIGDYKPLIYTRSNDENSQLRSIWGHPLEQLPVDSIWDARQAVERYGEVDNYKLYGYNRFANAWAYQRYDGKLSWKYEDVRVNYLDIENEVDGGKPNPAQAPSAINIIGNYDSVLGLYRLYTTLATYSLEEAKKRAEVEHLQIIKCQDERELLMTFVSDFAANYPHLLTGWNSEQYDVPYLINRLKRVLGEEWANKMSPWGLIEEKRIKTISGDESGYDIVGVPHIDFMKLYRKFTFEPRDNYKLDTIVKVELDKTKLHHESGIPGHLLYRSYPKDANQYNLQDVKLLVELEAKTNLLRLAMELAFGALINFDEVLSPMRMWENMIYIDLARRGVQFDFKPARASAEQFEGGYCKEPIKGKYGWVMSYDVDSEYPSIIRAMNMSPETLVAEASFKCDVARVLAREPLPIPEELTATANGVCFRKDVRGFLARLVGEMFANRKKLKARANELKRDAEVLRKSDKSKEPEAKEMEAQAKLLSIKEKALKVSMNSLYGIMGSPYFRFYDVRVAEGITLTGQALIQWVAADVNAAINKLCGTKGVDYVIAIDTDSNYYNVDAIVKRMFPNGGDAQAICDWVANKLQPKIQEVVNRSFKRFGEHMQCYEPSAFAMKREAIADSCVYAGKKRYVMNVLDTEGVRKTKIKMMGIEAIKSSTPPLCRKFFKEAVSLLLNKTEEELQDFAKSAYVKFKAAGLDQIAGNTSVSSVDGYRDPKGAKGRFKSGAPMNSKAAITYNDAIKAAGIMEKYEPIVDGDKMRFVNLIEPNPVGNDVIGFKDVLPPELKLEEYIDKEGLWHKTLLKPLTDLAAVAGWDVNKQRSIEDFF